jgi:membrane-associated phospholipid phosphatase
LAERGSGGGRSRRLFVCGVLILALFILVDITVESGLLQTFDVEGFTAVNSLRPPVWVDSAMVVFSLYGREGVWGGLIVVLFFLGGEREKKAAVTMSLIYLILIGAGYAVKSLDGRLRPYDALEGVRLLVPRESDYSFPSGHALIVSGGVVVAWIMLKRWLTAILMVEASLVAFSRIYVGVHYPMDVVGGALLGAGFSLVLCSNSKLIDRIYNTIPSSIRKLGRASLSA